MTAGLWQKEPKRFHSEWKGLGSKLQHLLMEEILTPSVGVSGYVAAFQHFRFPPSWPRIRSPRTRLRSWSLSEHGRAILLVPLILRCNAKMVSSLLSPNCSTIASLSCVQSQPQALYPQRSDYSLFAKVVFTVSTHYILKQPVSVTSLSKGEKPINFPYRVLVDHGYGGSTVEIPLVVQRPSKDRYN
jgi:hypothetical protein